MGLVYIPTWMVDFHGKCRSIYQLHGSYWVRILTHKAGISHGKDLRFHLFAPGCYLAQWSLPTGLALDGLGPKTSNDLGGFHAPRREEESECGEVLIEILLLEGDFLLMFFWKFFGCCFVNDGWWMLMDDGWWLWGAEWMLKCWAAEHIE